MGAPKKGALKNAENRHTEAIVNFMSRFHCNGTEIREHELDSFHILQGH